MANHLEFGSIAIGAPASVARLRAEVSDTVLGLRMAVSSLNGPGHHKVESLLKRAIRQLEKSEAQK